MDNKEYWPFKTPEKQGYWFGRMLEIEDSNNYYYTVLYYKKTIGMFIHEYPSYSLMAAAKVGLPLSEEQIDECARQSIYSALKYAPHLISKSRFEWCVKAKPLLAMMLVPHLLTERQIKWCMDNDPACRNGALVSWRN